VLQHLAATQERLHTHLMDLERQTPMPNAETILSSREVSDG